MSDKYEIWCVEQLTRAEKKVQNSIFVRPALHGAISFTICFIQQIFGEVFTSHIQLVLNIFFISCPFSDRIATGSFVNLPACGPVINSYPNIYIEESKSAYDVVSDLMHTAVAMC